jgi:uncharacterized caspase-like protein
LFAPLPGRRQRRELPRLVAVLACAAILGDVVRNYLGLLVIWLMLATGAVASERVALIIGNADYDKVGRLANPVNDATDLAAALTRIGFDVTLASDLDFIGMHRALQAFSRQAADADMAMVYFAGHGVEIDKQNYLIPTDAMLESDRQVVLETISLDLVTEAVSGAKSLRMVVLDACRNNPFLEQMVRSVASRSVGRGLGAFEPTGGTLVAYSAKGGTVASDGTGRNSPFMAGLLANIEEPGVDVSLMFRKVRDAVLKATGNVQEPFVYGSLPGEELYLVPAVADAPLEPEAPVPAQTVGSEQEEFAWSLVRESADADKLQQYLFAYPQGAHVSEAINLIKALRDAKDAAVDNLVPEPIAAPVAPEPEGPQLVAAIQSELTRAGCSPGAVDGIWGDRSRRAVAEFGRGAGVRLGDSPTPQLLDALKAKAGIVCVTQPGPREVKVGGEPDNGRGNGCYDVTVRVVAEHPEGGPWDPWGGNRANPDPIIIESTTGTRHACTDTFTCSTRISNAFGTLQFTILDDDPDADDPMGSAACTAGRSCKAGRIAISMSPC